MTLSLFGCSERDQRQVANTTGDLAAKADKAMDNASVTASVKTALVASKKLDTSALNVDTQGKNVFLRGSVISEEQRKLAEEIAKNTVQTGFTVVNQLAVGNQSTTGTSTAEPAAETGTPVVESTTTTTQTTTTTTP